MYLVGTPEQEARSQRVLLDKLDAKFTAALSAEITEASLAMIDGLVRTGSVPPLPLDHASRISEIYAHIVSLSILAFGDRVVGQGKTLGLVLETKSFAEFFARLAQEYIALEAIRRRIVQVSEATRQQIVNAVQIGQDSGQGIAEIAQGIRDRLPSLSRRRASVIARTETHGAANYGADGAARTTGLPMRKEWVSVEDHRTRDFGDGDGVVDEFSHRAMSGVVVDMEQPFMVPRRNLTSEPMMFPGDPNGSAANVINCRCAVAHIVDFDAILSR